MSRKIHESIWFGSQIIGIVATENSIGERKFYIGKGVGYNLDIDEQHIADYGDKVDPEMIADFFERNSK